MDDVFEFPLAWTEFVRCSVGVGRKGLHRDGSSPLFASVPTVAASCWPRSRP